MQEKKILKIFSTMVFLMFLTISYLRYRNRGAGRKTRYRQGMGG